jgi:hypothetical protein
MKTSHDNSQLDNFLRDTLKTLDIQYQLSDWSSMESQLGPAQKPIDFNVSKKTIFISASVLAIVIVGIIISQTVHFDNSSSEETAPQNTHSSQSLLNAVDTHKTTVTVVPPVAPAIDSAKNASPLPVQGNKIVDSVKIVPPADTTSVQKPGDKEKNNKKQDKKQKKNNLQNSQADTSSRINSIQPAPVDTASKHPVQEIKIAAPLAPADSSKSTAPAKKNKKNKRQKNISADSSKARTPSQAKPDSLK